MPSQFESFGSMINNVINGKSGDLEKVSEKDAPNEEDIKQKGNFSVKRESEYVNIEDKVEEKAAGEVKEVEIAEDVEEVKIKEQEEIVEEEEVVEVIVASKEQPEEIEVEKNAVFERRKSHEL